jgi:hypothetical protein
MNVHSNFLSRAPLLPATIQHAILSSDYIHYATLAAAGCTTAAFSLPGAPAQTGRRCQPDPTST